MSGRYRSVLDSFDGVLMNQETIIVMADIHLIKVANFQSQTSLLQASSFKLQVRKSTPSREDVPPKFITTYSHDLPRCHAAGTPITHHRHSPRR